mmetsp:Transcript_23623/g.59509  ORF Transcript_23623/g.59509 Transcript_23623/m.59509 type:complete len:125 (-) Transcript_23623:69-443(-)
MAAEKRSLTPDYQRRFQYEIFTVGISTVYQLITYSSLSPRPRPRPQMNSLLTSSSLSSVQDLLFQAKKKKKTKLELEEVEVEFRRGGGGRDERRKEREAGCPKTRLNMKDERENRTHVNRVQFN